MWTFHGIIYTKISTALYSNNYDMQSSYLLVFNPDINTFFTPFIMTNFTYFAASVPGSSKLNILETSVVVVQSKESWEWRVHLDPQ